MKHFVTKFTAGHWISVYWSTDSDDLTQWIRDNVSIQEVDNYRIYEADHVYRPSITLQDPLIQLEIVS